MIIESVFGLAARRTKPSRSATGRGRAGKAKTLSIIKYTVIVMKHESKNPVYSRFKHLLTRAGRYPAEHVDIFWNLTDNYEVKDVEAVFVPSEALRDDKLKAEYVRYNKRWESHLPVEDSTPEEIFGHLLHHGFASEAETRSALEEFAHIEECDWARLMLRGFKDE
jgi:hypothetical protein